MSDFTSGFWSFYVAVLTIASIVACGVLLVVMSKARAKASTSVATSEGAPAKETTGPVWEGGLAELQQPFAKMGAQPFLVTAFFGVIYLILYPGLGSLPG